MDSEGEAQHFVLFLEALAAASASAGASDDEMPAMDKPDNWISPAPTGSSETIQALAGTG